MSDGYFHCARCEWFGDEPGQRFGFEPFEFWGERGLEGVITLYCPCCGADDLDECMPCESCSDAPATHDGVCDECFAAAAAHASSVGLEVRA